MVKVNLPTASWEELDVLLEQLEKQGHLVKGLRGEIAAQVKEQEN